MKTINDETRKLLDRLYNLRGKDSVVLFGIEQECKEAETTREKCAVKKEELEKSINKLASDENILAEQGERLKGILKSINPEDFEVLIKRLSLDFNPEAIFNKINLSLPTTIANLVSEKKASEEKLVEVEEQMTTATTKIEELAIRKDDAIDNQNKLNEFFELALSGNSNLTRDSITALLEKFKFTKDEQREAAKLLMFPEDGLYDYEKKAENGEKFGKSMADIFQEAKESVVKENKKEEQQKQIVPEYIEPTVPILEVETKPDTIELSDEIKKEEVKNLLKVCGFNINDFSNQDINTILENYDSELISKNVEYINKLGINKGIFIDNIDFLYDAELKQKIDMLLNIGKDPMDIYLNPSVLIKYNLAELYNTINSLKESGLEPDKVPLMAF